MSSGSRLAVVRFSGDAGPAGIKGEAFFYGGNLRPLLGDENGFLLATPPGLAGRGVVGDALAVFDDISVEVLYVVKAFCRTNSQLSGRITRIRTVESTS